MRRVLLAIVSTVAALVLLLSFKTHKIGAVSTPPAAVGHTAAPGASSAPSTRPSSTAGTSGTPASSSTSGTGTAARTVTGDAADTIYGPVQVQITVKNGKVTGVQATEYPQDTPRDEQINAYAIPVLNQEALAAGSAHIDAVSGATYTSNGYATSLQSALDKAAL